MLSEIDCSGACQNLRATNGGTTATQATTIQYGMEVIPSPIAARHTVTAQPAKSSVLVFSDDMKRV